MPKPKLSALELLQALGSFEGIEFTDEQLAAVKDAARTQLRNSTTKIVTAKTESYREAQSESDDDFDSDTYVSDFVDLLFDLADTMAEQIEGKNVTKGQGSKYQNLLGIDTPAGHLRVELTNDPRD